MAVIQKVLESKSWVSLMSGKEPDSSLSASGFLKNCTRNGETGATSMESQNNEGSDGAVTWELSDIIVVKSHSKTRGSYSFNYPWAQSKVHEGSTFVETASSRKASCSSVNLCSSMLFAQQMAGASCFRK